MKHIHTFESFVNENLNEAKKEKFVLYTNPTNSTSRAYVAIGSEEVKDVMQGARQYAGSYKILYGPVRGDNTDLQKAIKMWSDYNFGDAVIRESELTEAEVNELLKVDMAKVEDFVDNLVAKIKNSKLASEIRKFAAMQKIDPSANFVEIIDNIKWKFGSEPELRSPEIQNMLAAG